MTPAQQQAAERAAVMLAFSEGREIEYYCVSCSEWHLDPMPDWDYQNFKWRIKPAPPKPRMCWANYDGKATTNDPWRMAFPRKQSEPKGWESIPMIELTPEVKAALSAAGIETEEVV